MPIVTRSADTSIVLNSDAFKASKSATVLVSDTLMDPKTINDKVNNPINNETCAFTNARPFSKPLAPLYVQNHPIYTEKLRQN